MKTISQLLIPYLFLSCFMVSCHQEEETINEIEDPWNNFPFEEVHISKTENFVKQFATLTGSELQNNHISEFLDKQLQQNLKDIIEETNAKMIDGGFDNFDLSKVYLNENQKVLFYPLFRTDNPTNLNHCMPFILVENPSSTQVLSEGPVTVAMALAAEADAKRFESQQVANHFLPVSVDQNGTGNFKDGMITHSYETVSGTVTIDYERLYDDIFQGVIKVEALSSDGTYSFKKMWKVTYN